MDYKEYKRKLRLSKLLNHSPSDVVFKTHNYINEILDNLYEVKFSGNDDLYFVYNHTVLFGILIEENTIKLNNINMTEYMKNHINYFVLNEVLNVSDYRISTSNDLNILYNLLKIEKKRKYNPNDKL